MTCPFLAGTGVLICTANSGVYVPSIFEIEEYCQSEKSKNCPYPSLMLFGIAHVAKKEISRGHERRCD